MAIRIFQPVYLHNIGRRSNNEDSIAPFDGTATLKDRLFIVCDGVGGANKGEVASRIVADKLQQYFSDNPAQQIGQNYLNRALQFVEGELQRYIEIHRECAGMATTLTLLYLNDQNNKATIAWVGDSRVYQVREGEILVETQDHSLVNELVRRGEITEEEAKVHPQRNVILRAITGSSNPVQIDVQQINDLQAGDYFLLCSDGILESVDNRILVTLLQTSHANLGKVRDQINSLCTQYSKDNYSMYLIQLSDVLKNTADLGVEDGSTQILDGLPASGDTAPLPASGHTKVLPSSPIRKKIPQKKNRTWLYGLAALALLGLLGLGFWTMYQSNQEEVYQKYVVAGDKAVENKDFDNAIAIYEKAAIDFPKNEAEIELKIALVSEQQQEEIQRLALRDSLLRETQFLYDQFVQIDSTQQEALNNVFGRTDELTLDELQQFVQHWQDSLKVLQPEPAPPEPATIEENTDTVPSDVPTESDVDTTTVEDENDVETVSEETDEARKMPIEVTDEDTTANQQTENDLDLDSASDKATETGDIVVDEEENTTEPDTILPAKNLEKLQKENMERLKAEKEKIKEEVQEKRKKKNVRKKNRGNRNRPTSSENDSL